MKKEIKIHDWTLINDKTDPYKAPETINRRLHGKVYGHPIHEDGTIIRTSSIIKVYQRTVETESGSVYKLGYISPKYKRWIDENGHTYNQADPFNRKARK
jgi:hypothetical protein|tara:strand:- start:461 stop:760 length:300 start_codon:yes stop_codon:yes gene_type:complete